MLNHTPSPSPSFVICTTPLPRRCGRWEARNIGNGRQGRRPGTSRYRILCGSRYGGCWHSCWQNHTFRLSFGFYGVGGSAAPSDAPPHNTFVGDASDLGAGGLLVGSGKTWSVRFRQNLIVGAGMHIWMAEVLIWLVKKSYVNSGPSHTHTLCTLEGLLELTKSATTNRR